MQGKVFLPLAALSLASVLAIAPSYSAPSEADFLIMPSLADTVPDWQTVEIGLPTFDRAALFAMHRYMGFVNYLGLPSLNLPIGRDERGRAICVQVLARPFAEHQLLNFAEQSPFVFWNL
jgi:aspartyl-tRNA(Asn)/glutamyl-tRNA(Gln) amidotransferase subunit A